jgi:hypothetical protein
MTDLLKHSHAFYSVRAPLFLELRLSAQKSLLRDGIDEQRFTLWKALDNPLILAHNYVQDIKGDAE